MRSGLNRDDLATAVGEDNVHVLPRHTALQYGFGGDTLRFLTEVGIPSSEEWELPFGIPEDFDPDLVWDCASRRERGWTFPEGVTRIVPLGDFPINAVVVDPDSGVVLQYTDAFQTAIPIHQDLSSFAQTLVSFVGYIESYASAPAEDPEAEDTRRAAEVRDLMETITRVDPLPFADPNSEWVELFDNLAGGVYT
ncbi:SUKH-4 family immunity protein [Streptomyces sp. LaPpAH-108]|uniref:SUKH-4 family immunity protein n=1 Tax=Streptomyces sp. LaPpAH-108 TaxID=1155714 RepID=UPI000371E822|nr:SUKH-4 family immunity protein [Streptomyces sp. LaPpAH-108]